ncbi:MAG: hypothetical protein PHU85_20200, partial [Phycisphaerae bacterium]|nr:hypothetical protein [Phycisphaerae bacterium]
MPDQTHDESAKPDSRHAMLTRIRRRAGECISEDARLDAMFKHQPAADLCYLRAMLDQPGGPERARLALDMVLTWQEDRLPRPSWAEMPNDRLAREVLYQELCDARRFPLLDDMARAAEDLLQVPVNRGPNFRRRGRKMLLSKVWAELKKLPEEERTARVNR